MEIAFQYGIIMIGLFAAMFAAKVLEALFQETNHTTISLMFGTINIILFFAIVTLMFLGNLALFSFMNDWMLGK